MFNKSQDGAVYRVSRSEKENSLGEKLFPLFLQISLLIKKIESYNIQLVSIAKFAGGARGGVEPQNPSLMWSACTLHMQSA